MLFVFLVECLLLSALSPTHLMTYAVGEWRAEGGESVCASRALYTISVCRDTGQE